MKKNPFQKLLKLVFAGFLMMVSTPMWADYYKLYSDSLTENDHLVIYNGKTKNATRASVDYAKLPFAYDAKDYSKLPTGLTQNGLGDAYSSSPYMKFDDTGDYIILKLNEAPVTLAFTIGGYGFYGGTFSVQTSTDGINYTNIATYTTLPTTANLYEVFYLTDSDVRYIKWIYTNKKTGNVGCGNISVKATPDYTRAKPSSSNFGTICLPYNAAISGGTLYNIASATFADSSTPSSLQSISLSEAGTRAEAGKGYIIKFNNDEVNVAYAKNKEVTTRIANNGIIGNPTTTGKTVEAGASNFVLQGGQLRYCYTVAATNGEYRAYIDASQIENNQNQVKAFTLYINNDYNSFDAIETTAVDTPLDVYIYNIAGQRVRKTTHGLYVINGKKVYVR